MIRALFTLLLLPSLSACGMENPGIRIGTLVLLPIVLVIVVLWLLLGRGGEENWDEKRDPDDEDDHTDYLM